MAAVRPLRQEEGDPLRRLIDPLAVGVGVPDVEVDLVKDALGGAAELEAPLHAVRRRPAAVALEGAVRVGVAGVDEGRVNKGPGDRQEGGGVVIDGAVLVEGETVLGRDGVQGVRHLLRPDAVGEVAVRKSRVPVADGVQGSAVVVVVQEVLPVRGGLVLGAPKPALEGEELHVLLYAAAAALLGQSRLAEAKPVLRHRRGAEGGHEKDRRRQKTEGPGAPALPAGEVRLPHLPVDLGKGRLVKFLIRHPAMPPNVRAGASLPG